MSRELADCAAPRRRYPLGLLGFFILLSVLMHLHSFFAKHREGDELSYLALARGMGWDLSNYSTLSDPVVSLFPHSIYRQELFHHPPLYPMILKIGTALGQPIFVGLAFQVRARSRAPAYLFASIYLFGAILTMSHNQVRYFAPIAPFLFVSFALQLRGGGEEAKRVVWAVAGLTFLSMVTSSFAGAIFNPGTAVVVPGFFFLLPFLRSFYI